MSIMHTTLVGATNSLGLEDANAMAYKAWRELQRARTAQTTSDLRDAVLNAAITAWHLVDWTWVGIAQTGTREPELAALFGVSGRPVEKRDLIAWAERECPELTLCQSLCNGTKHVKSERPLRTQAAAPEREGAPQLARLEIIDGATTRDALDVVEAAVMFWGSQVTRGSAMR